MARAPIGIFDSGLGGLTVARAIAGALPGEDLLYLGDTARCPYGPRDLPEVRRFVLEGLDRQRSEVAMPASLSPHIGKIMVLRTSYSTAPVRLLGVQYLEAWLRGQGCVPIYHLMEDAATAEISRTQVWQWFRHGATLEDGPPVTAARLHEVIAEELRVIAGEVGQAAFLAGRYATAAALFERLAVAPECEEFLTLSAYDLLEPADAGATR